VPPSVYLLVGSNPGLSDSVCVSFSDRSKASLDLLRAFSIYLSFSLPPNPLSLSLSLSLSFSPTELHSSKPRACTYTRIYVHTIACTCINVRMYVLARRHREREKSLFPSWTRARSLPEERERTHRQTERR